MDMQKIRANIEKRIRETESRRRELLTELYKTQAALEENDQKRDGLIKEERDIDSVED